LSLMGQRTFDFDTRARKRTVEPLHRAPTVCLPLLPLCFR
jgi:hypothetical protein